ncbi:MAG TPA: PAS domain-containing sensor histidine kinase [Bacteroidales bacterium]|nr:PAS domain-containing sensor histidine kinase [Bacteroidales bacterium]
MSSLTEFRILFPLLCKDKLVFDEFFIKTSLCLFLLDKTACLNDLNPASEKLLNQNKETAIGNNLIGLLNYEKENKEWDEFYKAIEAPDNKNQDKYYKLKTRKNPEELRYLNVTVITCNDFLEDKILIAAEDISDIFLEKTKSQKQEEELHIVFENDAVGIVISEYKDNIKIANQKFADITGYSIEELKSIKIRDITPKEDWEKEQKVFQQVINKKNKKFSLEKRLVRKDNSIIWVKLHTVFQWDTKQELKAIVAFIVDITLKRKVEEALKESEKKYRFITEKASDIIYSVSLDYKIKFHNKAIERIFDETIEDIEKFRYDHMMLPQDKELAKELHESRLRGERSAIFRHGFKTPKGKLVYLECSVSPLFDDNNNVIGSLGIARDITERVLVEEKLNQQNKQLSDLVATKDKFISVIAHDLRDPFNILLGFTELLIDNFDSLPDEKKKYYLEQVSASANTGYNLLKNLLDWSRSQTGQIKFMPQSLKLNTLIESVIQTVRISALNKKIIILFDFDKEYIANTDENMFRTVLRNLLNNAIKFSFPNSSILVTLNQTGQEYIISIRDTGIGIKPTEILKLFEPGEKTINKGTQNEKGTGLGLSICKDFVDTMGGRIWVESEYGQGTVFSFTVPAN